MNYNDLNLYIKHYIEKDQTKRAIMLTGDWGIGKSYYINNHLVPYLEKPENGDHQCIVISLYGLTNISDVSKEIYFETRTKKIRIGSEKGQATLLIGKTILKGIAGHFGINLNANEEELTKLYQSIDLSNKLVIIEDVERTKIDILDFLGYVNNLTEHDSVKVLLVTNEREIIRFDSTYKESQEDDSVDYLFGGITQSGSHNETKKYTEKTKKYLGTKEKTVSDTIEFKGDLKTSICEIIKSFDSARLKSFANNKDISEIESIMLLLNSLNLRSFIFACQKAADIYEKISDLSLSDVFLRTVFYGIIAFSLRINNGAKSRWTGLDHYSQELGTNRYPLFRFCYDYILNQELDISMIPIASDALDKYLLYSKDKSASDADLDILYTFFLHTESEVVQTIDRITDRLKDLEDIAFNEYGKIAINLVRIKYCLGIEVADAERLLIENLRGRHNDLSADELFWYFDDNEETKEEFIDLRQRMIDALNDGRNEIKDFEYLPEQASLFHKYVIDNKDVIYDAQGFARHLDISRLVTMFTNSKPAQMDEIRSTFVELYRTGNIKEFLSNDLPAITQLLNGIEAMRNGGDADKVQSIQINWFIKALTEIKNKLSR